MQHTIQHLFRVNSLEEVSRERLEELVTNYPSFGVGRYLLSRKLHAEQDGHFTEETQKTNLYFTNPFWLQWLLQNEQPVAARAVRPDEPRPDTTVEARVAAPDHGPAAAVEAPLNDGEEGNGVEPPSGEIFFQEKLTVSDEDASREDVQAGGSAGLERLEAPPIEQQAVQAGEVETPETLAGGIGQEAQQGATLEEGQEVQGQAVEEGQDVQQEGPLEEGQEAQQEGPLEKSQEAQQGGDPEEGQEILQGGINEGPVPVRSEAGESEDADTIDPRVKELLEAVRGGVKENPEAIQAKAREERTAFQGETEENTGGIAGNTTEGAPDNTEGTTPNGTEYAAPNATEREAPNATEHAAPNAIAETALNPTEGTAPNAIEGAALNPTEGTAPNATTSNRPIQVEEPGVKAELNAARVSSAPPMAAEALLQHLAEARGLRQALVKMNEGEAGAEEVRTEGGTLPAATGEAPGTSSGNADAAQTGADTPGLPGQEPSTAIVAHAMALSEPVVEFEPYHTIDYFASVGIKFVQDENPSDKLGKQLKSFTDWLKVMRRLPQKNQEIIPDMAAEHQIQAIAAHSIKGKEVLTETMAEVLVKQGMREKAAEVYHKLLLLNPDKSAYFAAKIEQLKID